MGKYERHFQRRFPSDPAAIPLISFEIPPAVFFFHCHFFSRVYPVYLYWADFRRRNITKAEAQCRVLKIVKVVRGRGAGGGGAAAAEAVAEIVNDALDDGGGAAIDRPKKSW